MKCPDCGIEIADSVHGQAHEIWEVQQHDRAIYQQSMRVQEMPSMSVTINYQGVEYFGTVYAVGKVNE
jgi:PHP family Zn ribbon phosphoesterase